MKYKDNLWEAQLAYYMLDINCNEFEVSVNAALINKKS